MNLNDFNNAITDELSRCGQLLKLKGAEYVVTEDRLHMFRQAAALQKCTPKQALLGMLSKHTVSVANMCMDTREYPLSRWREKITDSINYLLILYAMVVDEQEASHGQN